MSYTVIQRIEGGYFMPSDKPLINFVIPEELLVKVDRFRFENHFPSRAGAIKWLLEWSLQQNPQPKK